MCIVLRYCIANECEAGAEVVLRLWFTVEGCDSVLVVICCGRWSRYSSAYVLNFAELNFCETVTVRGI